MFIQAPYRDCYSSYTCFLATYSSNFLLLLLFLLLLRLCECVTADARTRRSSKLDVLKLVIEKLPEDGNDVEPPPEEQIYIEVREVPIDVDVAVGVTERSIVAESRTFSIIDNNI